MTEHRRAVSSSPLSAVLFVSCVIRSRRNKRPREFVLFLFSFTVWWRDHEFTNGNWQIRQQQKQTRGRTQDAARATVSFLHCFLFVFSRIKGTRQRLKKRKKGLSPRKL